MTVCATFESFKHESFLWSWWFWNQSQGKKIWHAIKGLVITSLGCNYQAWILNCYWSFDICIDSDLILGMPSSIQVWYGTPRPSDLKPMCLFRWIPLIYFHWECLLLLWPWQSSNWFGWCMLGSSSIKISTWRIIIFQTQRWQFCAIFNSFRC